MSFFEPRGVKYPAGWAGMLTLVMYGKQYNREVRNEGHEITENVSIQIDGKSNADGKPALQMCLLPPPFFGVYIT